MWPTTLAELADELEGISARASDVWALPQDPCVSPPAGGWSAAQCLSHLARSTDAYLPVWHAALDNPGPDLRLREARPLRLDLWGRLLCWFLEPPPKIRFRTKGAFEAPSSPGALEEFLASQRSLLALIAQCEGLAIDRMQIRSAYDSRVRYSVWSSLVTTLAHQRRHLWQAEDLYGGSPRSSPQRGASIR